MLQIDGADVFYHDPYIPSLRLGDNKYESLALNEETLKKMDCVVIATDHSSMPLELILEHAPLVYDTRNVTKGVTGKGKIVRLGGGDY
jgi:UDP-N-acetyl-D-glucosamine dehydrogenase